MANRTRVRPQPVRPTMDDVAAVAGVSRGTVSRVLNGGHNVSRSSLDAVERAIRKTGYVVNQHARSLVTQRAGSVAFILSEPQDRLFEARRGLTPLFWTHVAPYGEVKLNMGKRLALRGDTPAQ